MNEDIKPIPDDPDYTEESIKRAVDAINKKLADGEILAAMYLIAANAQSHYALAPDHHAVMYQLAYDLAPENIRPGALRPDQMYPPDAPKAQAAGFEPGDIITGAGVWSGATGTYAETVPAHVYKPGVHRIDNSDGIAHIEKDARDFECPYCSASLYLPVTEIVPAHKTPVIGAECAASGLLLTEAIYQAQFLPTLDNDDAQAHFGAVEGDE